MVAVSLSATTSGDGPVCHAVVARAGALKVKMAHNARRMSESFLMMELEFGKRRREFALARQTFANSLNRLAVAAPNPFRFLTLNISRRIHFLWPFPPPRAPRSINSNRNKHLPTNEEEEPMSPYALRAAASLAPISSHGDAECCIAPPIAPAHDSQTQWRRAFGSRALESHQRSLDRDSNGRFVSARTAQNFQRKRHFLSRFRRSDPENYQAGRPAKRGVNWPT